MNQQIASIIIIMLNLANESSAVKLDGIWKKIKKQANNAAKEIEDAASEALDFIT